LAEAEAFIRKVIKNEEIRFIETLDNGLKLLNDTLSEMEVKEEKVVPGHVIFKLYDTYGFPVDIVRDVVRDKKLSLDMDGFDKDMEAQRKKSKAKVKFSSLSDAYISLTETGIKPEFVGYATSASDAKVLLLVKDGKAVDEIRTTGSAEMVTSVTPFYGEAGGQVGDIGIINAPDFEMKVVDTIKDPTGLIIHKGEVKSGTIRKDDLVSLTVDAENRAAIAANHTATHILHYALRKVLGDHVKQAGSLVASDRFRFDFTHFSQVSLEEIKEIESIVNHRIRENISVFTQEMEAEEAFKSGATALFEEKYGDQVRVVSLSSFSKELCGGTHTAKTGNIGLFKIVSESSIASGVRRIESFTGHAALKYFQDISGIVQESAAKVRGKVEEVPRRIESLLASQKEAEKEIEKLKAKIAEISAGDTQDNVVNIKGVSALIKRVPVDNPAALRDLADKFKDKLKSGIVVLGSAANEKVLLIAVVSKDLTDRYHAGNLIKEISKIVGGGGGGRPDMAQAGGTQPERLDEALQSAKTIIESME